MKNKSKRGMTLIEILLAMSIIAIVSLLLFKMFLFTAKIDKESMSISQKNTKLDIKIDKSNFDNTLPTTSDDIYVEISGVKFKVSGVYRSSSENYTENGTIKKRLRTIFDPAFVSEVIE